MYIYIYIYDMISRTLRGTLWAVKPQDRGV